MATKLTKNNALEHLKGNVGLGDDEAKILLSNFFETLEEEVAQGTNVKFYQFGTFSRKTTKPRKGKNFQTGEEVLVAESKKISFKATKKALETKRALEADE